MNNEPQLLIDEAYENYRIAFVEGYIHEELDKCLSQEEFIEEIKTDKDFSEKWGLKIEERVLTTVRERKKYDIHFDCLIGEYPGHHETLDKRGVPKKITTITYNDKKIEIYE